MHTRTLNEVEIAERVATLKRFRSLLEEQRLKFRRYLEVLAQNKKNRDLLQSHMTGLRQQIASLKRPYAHKESIFAEAGATAAFVDVSL